MYDMFEGVNYEIDISKPVGERIVNLTWPDGTPVEEDETLVIAVSNYRGNSALLIAGIIFEEGNLPELLETDIQGMTIHDILVDYVFTVCNGTITPEVSNNWRIIGNNWDEELHQKAVSQINAGLIQIPSSEDGRTINIAPIRVEDLK